MIQVRYFASIREALGIDHEDLVYSQHTLTIGAVLGVCRAQSERHAAVLSSAKPIRAALNQTLAVLDTPVQDGDEIAFFPPVTGG